MNITPNKNKALMLAKREVAVFVKDAVALEGIHFTLPEIQTLLQGITVGGHKLSEEQIAVNQGNAWAFVFDAIKNETFCFNHDFVCQLHNIAAKEEALQWGCFRTGGVTIAGSSYTPPKASELVALFNNMVEKTETIDDIYDKAISIFLTFSRHQFFYDVNKRMGRFIMNAVLLNAGYLAINLPAKRQLEFNQLMMAFYVSADETEMNRFLRSCLDPRMIEIMNEK
ncbi:MAG: Fic family protein [Alteromonadaceae bacterium]|nr:Fic family protein [Alteromonadaceae bacterium]